MLSRALPLVRLTTRLSPTTSYYSYPSLRYHSTDPIETPQKTSTSSPKNKSIIDLFLALDDNHENTTELSNRLLDPFFKTLPLTVPLGLACYSYGYVTCVRIDEYLEFTFMGAMAVGALITTIGFFPRTSIVLTIVGAWLAILTYIRINKDKHPCLKCLIAKMFGLQHDH